MITGVAACCAETGGAMSLMPIHSSSSAMTVRMAFRYRSLVIDVSSANDYSRKMSDREPRVPSASPVLQLMDATLVRGGVPVLQRVSLTIDRGEHTAILGGNGAGKSSLIRMLML